MNKDIKSRYLLLVVNAIVGIFSAYLIFQQDKLTAILLIIVLLTKPVTDIITLKKLYKDHKDAKFIFINKKYVQMAYLLLLLSIGCFVYQFKNLTPLGITIAAIIFLYVSVVHDWAMVRYGFNIFMYRNRFIDISSIKKIKVIKEKNTIETEHFNNTTNKIKLSDESEIKIVEKILRRK